MEINKKAFSVLSSALLKVPNPKPWKGKSPLKWCEAVTGAPCSAALVRAGPDPMDRKQLLEFCIQPDVDAQDIFLAVCAWGGMRIDHGRRAWRYVEKWRPAIHKLRADCPNRREAYRIFSCLRAEDNLPGVGPAYFTKLIFFAHPRLNGYIMDQWTSRSINLLYGMTVKLTGGQSVALNDPDIYEEFCRKIEDLGQRLQRSPAEAERAIFSYGGKHPGLWRSYVKRHG